MDPFGDHAVCCKLNNFYVRQNMVADAVSRVLAGVGVHTDREAMVAGTWKKTTQSRKSGQKPLKNPALKWQRANHANMKIVPRTLSTTPGRLPLNPHKKPTSSVLYNDSVVIFRRPAHPPFWIPIFSTSSVIP